MTRSRVGAGVPTGGQFDAGHHDEADVDLDDDTPHHLDAATYLAAHPGVAEHAKLVELDGTIWEPVHTVVVGCRDEYSIEAFKNGQCHALALALHERTAWPIVSVGPDECVYDEDCDPSGDSAGVCACQIHHLAIRRPDGWIVDIEGPRPEPDFIEGSTDPDNTLKPAPADRLDSILRNTDGTWRTPNLAVARAFVDVALTPYDPD